MSAPAPAAPPPQRVPLYPHRYGVDIAGVRLDDLSLEALCFHKGWTTEQGGLGRYRHFKNWARQIWPTLEWNPWLCDKLQALCDDDSAVIAGKTRTKTVAFTGCAAAGKAQPLDAIVYTPTGPTCMGNLKVGDLVCAPDGGVTRVVGVFPQGERDVYRVTLSDDSSAECCIEHLWRINDRCGEKVVDTAYLLKNVCRYKEGRNTLSIDYTRPVKFERRPMPLQPYLVGALLGDGSLGGNVRNGNIGFSCVEAEIIERMQPALEPYYQLRRNGQSHDFTITRKQPVTNGRNAIKEALRELGLWNRLSDTKFIPEAYLYGDIETRLELVRGLMDTDGTVQRGKATYYSTSKALANGFRSLIQSLGGTCRICLKKPFFRYRGKRKRGKDCYVCHVRIADPSQLFHLSRKKHKCKPGLKRSERRVITDVEFVGRKAVQCIRVEHPDHLYLTDGFLPTHNTHDAAFFASAWWRVDPSVTTVILCSTTKEMLRKRTWAPISWFWSEAIDPRRKCKDPVGHMIDSRTKLLWKKGDDLHGIFGIAVGEGETQKAVQNIKGMHSERMMVVVDEAEATPEAIFEAIANLRKGCSEFILVVLGNSVSRLDAHGQICEPRDGWGSISVESTEWPTKGVPKWQIEPGICLHFDGTKSPNVKARCTKYHYLYSWENYLAAQQRPDYMASMVFWQHDRGFWPPEGLSDRLFTEQMVEKYNGSGRYEFLADVVPIAFLDPAFGGDECKLLVGRLGTLAGGRKGLQIDEAIVIPIPAVSKDEIDYIVARRCIEELKKRSVQPAQFGTNATGTGRGVHAIIAGEWSSHIHRVEDIGQCSDRPSSTADGRPAKEVYDRAATESWFSAREVLQSGQLKGLYPAAVIQLCARIYGYLGRKYRIEPKDEFKVRLGRSSDDADAVVGLVEVARRNGLQIATPIAARADKDWEATLKEADSLYDDGPHEASYEMADLT